MLGIRRQLLVFGAGADVARYLRQIEGSGIPPFRTERERMGHPAGCKAFDRKGREGRKVHERLRGTRQFREGRRIFTTDTGTGSSFRNIQVGVEAGDA